MFKRNVYYVFWERIQVNTYLYRVNNTKKTSLSIYFIGGIIGGAVGWAEYEALWKQHALSQCVTSSKVSPAAAKYCFCFPFSANIVIHIPAWHLGMYGTMKGNRIFVVFLVLCASVIYTTEAARSRTSNQNSFRRAANGIYQTLSSVFGEDNIRGVYKVGMVHLLSSL